MDQLVVDLRRAAPQGGVLPVLQIVCGRLYQKTRLSGEPPPSWVIGLRDYEGFGRVIDLIDGYFTDTLRTLFARLLSGREPETIEAELYRWRRLLLALVRRQPDGTVTSELKPALELDGEARKVGCLLPFGPTAEDLAQEQRRILRRNEVLHQDGRIVLCYSLGHDILGQAMLKWQDEDKNVKWQMNAVASLTVASAKSKTATSDYEPMNIVDAVRNVAATKSKGDAGWHNQILWVDDNPNNNIYERRSFESVGVHFTLAESTHEALSILETQKFAAIISDMGRREGPREGYVLLDTVRALGIQIPLFFYASSNSLKHKEETAEHGGQGCTNNPQELFRDVMAALLKERRAGGGHAVSPPAD